MLVLNYQHFAPCLSLIAAIDWSEPFIIGILTMHVLLLTIAVFLRHALYTQGAIQCCTIAAPCLQLQNYYQHCHHYNYTYCKTSGTLRIRHFHIHPPPPSSPTLFHLPWTAAVCLFQCLCCCSAVDYRVPQSTDLLLSDYLFNPPDFLSRMLDISTHGHLKTGAISLQSIILTRQAFFSVRL